MRKLTWALGAVAGVGILATVAMAPWASPPPLVYESVSGYPMRLYYRNVGESHVKMNAVAGLPALTVDAPLPPEKIDSYFISLKGQMKPANSIVRAGDRS